MPIFTTLPKFLYPTSRQFPFDEVVEKIVRALEKRNWYVPGIKVEFHDYGSGEAKYRKVDSITGPDFKLSFWRVQGSVDSIWNDSAGVDTIYIPKQILQVYEDNSGPTYFLYVGENWEADKDWFMNSNKALSKLLNEPRRYLRYSGRSNGQLKYDNDLGREYSPKGDEPKTIDIEQKFEEFTKYLEENVLSYIINGQRLISYNGPWKTLYSACNEKAAKRLLKGKENPSELLPEERHAFFGSGMRLAPLYVNYGVFPRVAYDGFIWCDPNPKVKVTPDSKLDSEAFRIMRCSYSNCYIVDICPKYANDIYVADHSKFEEKRQEIFKENVPRMHLSNEELGVCYAERAKTLVPINEYNDKGIGKYKQPLVLIKRELDFDEIESVQYKALDFGIC